MKDKFIHTHIQHPYGESDVPMLQEAGNTGAGAYLSYMRMPQMTPLATTAVVPTPAPVMAPTMKSSSQKNKLSLFLGLILVSGLFFL